MDDEARFFRNCPPPHLRNTTVEPKEDSNASQMPETVKENMPIGPDGLCTEDHLSHLNDHCLLKIFKHLTRLEIFNICVTNKRLLPLYVDHSLHNIKWAGGDLLLTRTERGYAFKLRIENEDYPWSAHYNKLIISYQYEIVKDSRGRFVETRKRNGVLEKSSVTKPHSWAVPTQFFTALAEILCHHEVKMIEIESIPFTAIFFTKLQKVLEGHNMQSLTCTKMACTKHISDETRMSFVQLIKDIPCVNVKDSKGVKSLLNEDFFNAIGDSAVRDREFVSSNNAVATYPHRFSPQISILVQLIKFKKLEAITLVLNADWIACLFMMFMDLQDDAQFDVNWEIAVDQDLAPHIIVPHIRIADYEYFYKSWHFIVNRRTGAAAKFYTEMIRIDNQRNGPVVFNLIAIIRSKPPPRVRPMPDVYIY